MLSIQSRTQVSIRGSRFSVSLAHSDREVAEAQRLRYRVFAEEMGANIVAQDGLDVDHHDSFCRHLIVREHQEDRVVGCYRLLTAEAAHAAGGWYSAGEFDLTRLQHVLPQTVELGRACVHADFRGGPVITMLWAGLMQFMQQTQRSYMMGCGSVSMADGGHFAASLFHQIQQQHYAPAEYRVFPKNPLPIHALQQELPVDCPALIKGYLRAGAYICGEPHWDADFHSADMLVMLPLSRLNGRYARHFSTGALHE
ncbi:GNAT family N-acetyltransferase [Snodgrassella sp. CFCC 13594]|uniref:GNAT family N-acetyltransferase n=1 Tax=Snodgrassella sp. CFCC 13594 TaxID=1775559 RepID=UPI00083298D5|nr:GNAT family N-acyltransferase [Snodgrassella sp. CFCC 13594]